MDIVLIVLIILSISLFFNRKFMLNSAAAPMFSVALITVFLCLMGMINLLVTGVYVVCGAALLSLIYVFAIKRYPIKSLLIEFFSPGLIFFIAGTIFFFLVLKWKNAIFRDWDEFSFWGTAAKTVFFHDKLYTFVPVSFPLAYPPALPVFSYFSLFFNKYFIEYRVYLAYDIMITAALATMFSRIKWKNVIAIVAAVAFSFIGVYAFFHASEGLKAYATSYSDMQMGFLLGGAMLMWFSSERKGSMSYFASLTVLSLITFSKDMGFAVSLIAATVMAFDMILSKNYPFDSLTDKSVLVRKLSLPFLLALLSIPLFLFSGVALGISVLITVLLSAVAVLKLNTPATGWLEKKGKLLFRIAAILILFITILLLYRLWAVHYNSGHKISRAIYPQISLSGIIGGQNEVANLILNDMKERFFNHSIICFGTVFEMTLVFTLGPIVMSLFTADKKKIVRMSAFSIMMALGFIAYYLFHAYLYIAILPNIYTYETLGYYDLVSYNRYISSYAIGWLFSIIGVLFFDVAKPFFKRKVLTFIPAVAAAAAMVIAVFRYTPDHCDQYLLTSRKVIISESGPRQSMVKHLARVRSALTPGDRIYFISFSTDGGEWFYLLYEVFPALLEKELGVFADPDIPNTEDVFGRYVGMDKKGFSDFLKENRINIVYVNYRIDDYFLEEFSPLFADGLMYAFDDSTRLYYVLDTGDDLVKLLPILNKEQLSRYKSGGIE